MTVTTRIQDSTGLAVLAGRFSFEDHRAFKEATDAFLADGGIREIHLDLSGITDIDASSLGMLLVFREKAELHGREVHLLSPAPCARALLDKVQFGRLFSIR